MAPRLPNFGPRTRKVLRYVGLGLVALITFVFAFQLTFPFGRVKDKVIELLSDKYEVAIGDVEGGWLPGRVYFKAVSLRTRPTAADEVASVLYVEKLQVDIGLFALLRGTVDVDLDAKIGAGHIKGDVALSTSNTSISLTGNDLPSQLLPMREVVGLPMSGKLRFAFDLDLPNTKGKSGKAAPDWLKADANVEFGCPTGCTVGDGKAKLKPKLANQRNQAFAEGGIDFGKVSMESLFAAAELKNGKLTITKLETKSADGELHVDFVMTLNSDLNQSGVDGCLRFRGSDSLLKREPKTHAAISTTGAPLGPDNLFHIKLAGTLRDLRRLGQVCGAAAGNQPNANPVGSSAPTPRPNLEPPLPPTHPSMVMPGPVPSAVPSAVPPPLPPPPQQQPPPGSTGGSAETEPPAQIQNMMPLQPAQITIPPPAQIPPGPNQQQ